MEDREIKIPEVALEMAVRMVASGLSYREGMACVECLSHAMERIDKDPDLDDNVLVEEMTEIVRVRLATLGGDQNV